MKTNSRNLIKVVAGLTLSLVTLALVSRCGSTTTASQTLVQIERLGRPAINEGLVLTNASLQAFNGIDPTYDLTSSSNATVATVISEVTAVLTAVTTFGAANFGSAQPGVANVAAGFLPDVMRVNTELSITPSDTSNSQATGFTHMAYNADYALVGGTAGQIMLTGGRKIEDGVMNITLAYLFAGAAAATTNFTSANVASAGWSDKLTYDMKSTCAEANSNTPTVPNVAAANNAQAPGHYCLYGQSYRYATANFPYLAKPVGSY